jgi:murein DD-endopeptidase MepM/ murein hydrolase activator NlpD
MPFPRVTTAVVATWLAWQVAAPTVLAQGQGLEVSTWARAYRPGEVVLVTVRAAPGVGRLAGSAFAAPLAFWPTAPDGPWVSLVGIPITTKPGSYRVLVHADEARAESAQSSIVVTGHTFETRRLKVDDRFINPPASEAARIAREAKQLAALFAGRRPVRLWQGPFVAPVPGPTNSAFGRLSVYNGKPGSRHQGADFQAATGTPIVAPNAGVVVLASDLYFSGNTVVVDHGDGLFSLMAHLSRMAVDAGSTVGRGDRLGEVGATGRVTGPHLHWAVRLRGVSVDPLSLIAAIEAMAGVKRAP